MKIISVLAPLKFGGGERLILDQAKTFLEKGIEYVVVCFKKSQEFEELLKKEKIRYINLTKSEFKQTPTKREYLFLFFKLLPSIWRLRKIIVKEKPDILLSNGFPSVFLIPLSVFNLKPTPKIFYIHHSVKAKEFSFVRKIYLWFLKKYKKIIGVSSLTEKTLKDIFPEIKDRILSIPNGIDTERFNIKESKIELRKKLNLPGGILALNVGRLAFLKNQKFLIEVARKINNKDFFILIIGDGDEYENLKSLIEKEKLQDRVRLLGRIESEYIPYYLKVSDIFLFPSLKEGFGIVVTEAMAGELPVIIFNDIYTSDFGKSILVANNKGEFIKLTQNLLNDEDYRRKLGRQNKEYIKKNLDIKIIGEKLLEILNHE